VAARQTGETRRQKLASFCRENPVTVVILVSFTLAGGVGGVLLPFEDLSLARRIIGGLIAGAYFGMLPLGKRLFE
jgi:hypothetical protein